IVPRSASRALNEDVAAKTFAAADISSSVMNEDLVEYDLTTKLERLQREMAQAAAALEFERAASIRDEIKALTADSNQE
ncbi:MAG: UvrB/UvrC motif-containing protein, partial [Kiritimatiellae bacterium]|nr:UvrB/UvrC motif-containing protein [Kiritimatiellia bacterium]